MKQVTARSVVLLILICLFLFPSTSAAGDIFDKNQIDEAFKATKEIPFKIFSFVLSVAILIIFLRTTVGFISAFVIFSYNSYEKIGLIWSFIIFLFLYAMLFGLIETIFGEGRAKTKKMKSSGGPIGGSHYAEATILDKHYDNVVAVWAARKIRDKFFRF